jgi:carbon monoxide dehydrogenase subunit G
VPRNEASVDIERPAEAIFPWLLERDKRLQWVEGLESSDPLDGPEPRAGSRFRETIAQHGLRTTVETRIAEIDPPRRLTLAVDGRRFEVRTETRLEERDGRTRVVSSIDTKVRGLGGRVAGAVVSSQAQGSLERSLATLKRLVETN